MIPIAIATEDALSEAIARRLVAELQVPCEITLSVGKKGSGYLRSKINSWRQISTYQPVLLLADLDRVECPAALREDWLSGKSLPANLIFRIAVREVESWVLADHDALRELLGAKSAFPVAPDHLADPKQVLLGLARRAPKIVRDDLVRLADGDLRQGLGYNARLTNWVGTAWSPVRAAQRSPSLARARRRLKELAHTFQSGRANSK